MKQRLPLILSATALVVAVFGTTPLGHAARGLADKVPPFAQRAGFADNAGSVNGIKASRRAQPGLLVALGSNGKFPRAVGAIGPTGAHGEKGEKGDAGAAGAPGLSGLEILSANTSNDSAGLKGATVTCPTGKRVVGGGGFQGATGEPIALIKSQPDSGGTSWTAQAREINGTSNSWQLTTYAICAVVAG